MDLWLWYGFYPHTEAALLARLAAGVPFNIAHAAGNVVLALVGRAGAPTRARALRTPLADGGRVGVKLLAPPCRRVLLATPAGYVQSQQRADGGFGDPQLTAWATLGLVAAGADTGQRGASTSRTRRPQSATEIALVAMARAAAGDRPDDLLRGSAPRSPASW